MKLLIAAAAAAALLLAAVLAQSPPPASKATVTLYATKCGACHGPDGHASVPAGKVLGARDFHSAAVQGESDAALAGVIGNGKNKMPSYKTQLSQQQIQDLVAYIRQLGQK